MFKKLGVLLTKQNDSAFWWEHCSHSEPDFEIQQERAKCLQVTVSLGSKVNHCQKFSILSLILLLGCAFACIRDKNSLNRNLVQSSEKKHSYKLNMIGCWCNCYLSFCTAKYYIAEQSTTVIDSTVKEDKDILVTL